MLKDGGGSCAGGNKGAGLKATEEWEMAEKVRATGD